LGAKASDPTVDNDGNALTTGDQYFNTTANELRVYNGSTWQSASTVGGTVTSLNVTGVASFADGSAAAPSITNDGDTNTGIFFPAADTIAFTEGGVESVRINSSGNVGIGTTSGSARLNVNGGTSTSQIRWEVNNAAFTQEVSTNAAANAYVYKSNDASYHVWKLSNTEAMVLNASGNVGIAQVSPSFKLDITGTLRSTGEARFDNAINLKTATLNQVYFDDAVAFTRNGTGERMRIDSSGNVGIGTSSPAEKLSVAGAIRVHTASSAGFTADAKGGLFDFVPAANNVRFGYVPGTSGVNTGILSFVVGSGSEAARIDSSGNFLLGGTTQPVNTYRQVLTMSGGAFGGLLFNDGDSSAVYPAIYFRKDGAQRGNILVTTSGTTYNTVSDYRLKEDVVPMVGALAKVSALKPVTYKWKSSGLEGQGFIAHELAEICPDAVTGDKDAVGEEQYEVTPAVMDEDGNTVTDAVMGTRIAPVYQGIDTSFLVATLTAAIQEQQATIVSLQDTLTSLTARITALEST